MFRPVLRGFRQIEFLATVRFAADRRPPIEAPA
jgi:hypothetical protein